MTTESLQQTMTDDDRAKFERGAEMLKHLQAGRGFDEHWVPVGEGLLAVRRTVMAALSLKKVHGSGSGYYRDAFSKMIAKTPYAEMHKVESSNLLYCMEHLADILEMRVSWTTSERAKINHPTSMAQRLRAFLNRVPDEKPRRNVSPVALLKDKNQRLARDNIELQERVASLENDSGSLFDLKLSPPAEIAKVIVANVSAYKAREIHKYLGDAIKAAPRAKALLPAG